MAGRPVLAFVLAVSTLASALPAWAICEPQEGQRLTIEAAHRIMLNPQFLLREQISSYSFSVLIMQYAAMRSRDLDVLKLILPRADKNQQEAIGVDLREP